MAQDPRTESASGNLTGNELRVYPDMLACKDLRSLLIHHLDLPNAVDGFRSFTGSSYYYSMHNPRVES